MKKQKTKRVSKTEVVNIITTKTKGRFFTVTFETNGGKERSINGNYKRPRKNSKMNNLGYLNVYSAKDMGYRNVNCRTIKQVVFKNVIYKTK